MKTLALAVLVALGAGCTQAREFSRGFADEASRQAFDIGLSALETKLGGKIDSMPRPAPPPSPQEQGTWATLGALVAYALGSVGKGMIRAKMEGKEKTTT